jgi:hypothetical protein
VKLYGREWALSFLEQKMVRSFSSIWHCSMGTEHIPSPEVIKELLGGLKALSGKTVVMLVYMNLS